MKTCTKCSETKSRKFFSKNSRSKDGLSSWCKHCFSLNNEERKRRLAETTKCKYCDRPISAVGTGLCSAHQDRFRKGTLDSGLPIRGRTKAAIKNKDGYMRMYMPEHPNAYKNGYILEHTVVMSEHLGRPLLPHENVHHKNGQRDDNRIENLELWSKSQPYGQRVEDKIEWAIELLKTYRPDILSV